MFQTQNRSLNSNVSPVLMRYSGRIHPTGNGSRRCRRRRHGTCCQILAPKAEGEPKTSSRVPPSALFWARVLVILSNKMPRKRLNHLLSKDP